MIGLLTAGRVSAQETRALTETLYLIYQQCPCCTWPLMLALAIISRLAPDILAIRLWMRGHGLMALAIVLMAVMALLSPEARPPLCC